MRTTHAISGLLLSAAAASAQQWGTFSNFSATSNPAFVWSYGWQAGGPFTLFDRPAMLTPELAIWSGSQFPDNAPCVGINPTPNAHTVPGTTISVPPQAAWARPGAAGQAAVFRFTAPRPGRYSVNGVFRQIDPASTTAAHLSVLVAGLPLMAVDIQPGGALVMDPSPYRILKPDETIDFILSGSAALEIEGHVSYAAGSGCYVNCDSSTTTPFLNVNDFACFLNAFATGKPYANCDLSTNPPYLNVLDFACFLNNFAAGCSAP